MKALVTGVGGTVGNALRAHLQAAGHQVVGWDRAHVAIDRYDVMEAYVRGVAPDALFHLAIASRPTGRQGESWLVNYEWSGELAWICRQLGVPLVFASTVMAFTDAQPGPYRPDSLPDATEGYGGEKRRAEERVREQEPGARVVRLGWQIGAGPGSNNMVDWVERQLAEHGVVRASRRWYPACAFLEDTAAALVRALELPPGVYMADSNRGWSFDRILAALARRRGDAWPIEPVDDYAHDQRMIDPRLDLTPLSRRLPALQSIAPIAG